LPFIESDVPETDNRGNANDDGAEEEVEDELNEHEDGDDDDDDGEVYNSGKAEARIRNLNFEPRKRRYELIQSKSTAKGVVAEFYSRGGLGKKYGEKVAAELQKLDEEVYTTSERDSGKPKKRRRK